MGWTGSAFYLWFADFDENTLRPMFIRKYCKQMVVLEDEYQKALKTKLDEDVELEDLADRV